uniref:Mediator of RNA polymerase II transcription subunit 6 n=1 Tax=Hyaloperonospora arabidopsidis (strain Emoy2) TaxID=559515 RepID=M4C4K5_HYAAE
MEVAAHADDYNASFRDTVWLQSFPLNPQTVLHYFALSPFYDRSCNNERLKMQRLGLDQLKNLRGIEYELLPNAAKQLPQQLYVIRKQRRSSRTQVEPLAVYYVLDGTVYQAPNIHAMLTSRLKKCSYRINKAFHGLAAGVRFSPTEGYAWDFSSKDKKEPVIPSEQLQLKLKQKYEKMEKQRENSARVDSILIQLMKKHAPEIAEKLENNNAAAAARAAGREVAGVEGVSTAGVVPTHDKTESASAAAAVKRQKVS